MVFFYFFLEYHKTLNHLTIKYNALLKRLKISNEYKFEDFKIYENIDIDNLMIKSIFIT
jgi:hypothetical protein